MTADTWLTLEEAATYLKVSKPTLYRWMADGRLRFSNLRERALDVSRGRTWMLSPNWVSYPLAKWAPKQRKPSRSEHQLVLVSASTSRASMSVPSDRLCRRDRELA